MEEGGVGSDVFASNFTVHVEELEAISQFLKEIDGKW